MMFLLGLGILILSLVGIVAVVRTSDRIGWGIRSNCMLGLGVFMGIGLMVSAACEWTNSLFSSDNVTNGGPAPVSQKTIAWSPTSTFPPTQKTIFHPVTWMELASFLSDDHTNWSGYDPNYYACMDFSIDLVENAGKRNIKAWIVGVDFYNEEDGHAFVAFETTDLGVVFIEPQKDFRYMNPMVGKPLCDASTGTVCQGAISSIEYVQCDHSHMCTQYFP